MLLLYRYIMEFPEKNSKIYLNKNFNILESYCCQVNYK